MTPISEYKWPINYKEWQFKHIFWNKKKLLNKKKIYVWTKTQTKQTKKNHSQR